MRIDAAARISVINLSLSHSACGAWGALRVVQ